MPDISKPQVQATISTPTRTVALPDNNLEGQMAKADLYRAAKMSIKLFQMIQDNQDLEEWIQAKITKSADYLDSIYHYMEYQMKFGSGEHTVTSVDDITSELDATVAQPEERAEEDDEEALDHMDESMNYQQQLKALLESAMIKKGIKEAKKAKPDFLDVDKDGNKKEPMKKAIKDKKVKEARDEDGDEYGWDVKEKKTKAPASRKVAGKAYGGSAQKDEPTDDSSEKKAKGKKVAEATSNKKEPAKKPVATKKPAAKKPDAKAAFNNMFGGSAKDLTKNLTIKKKEEVKESADLDVILKLAGRRPLNG